MRRTTPQLLKIALVMALTCGSLCLAAYAMPWRGLTLAEWWRAEHDGEVSSEGSTSEKVVALTFDDGPSPRYTPRVLDTLRAYGVHATFFMVGHEAEACPDLARRVLAEGHSIGNHSYSHRHLTQQNARAVHAEMEKGDRALTAVLGVHPHLFRPPYGHWNALVLHEAARDHEPIILWTTCIENRRAKTPQAMAQRALGQVRPGAILLLHDGGDTCRETTVEALPLLLDGLRKRGYRCVTVPELLKSQHRLR